MKGLLLLLVLRREFGSKRRVWLRERGTGCCGHDLWVWLECQKVSGWRLSRSLGLKQVTRMGRKRRRRRRRRRRRKRRRRRRKKRSRRR